MTRLSPVTNNGLFALRLELSPLSAVLLETRAWECPPVRLTEYATNAGVKLLALRWLVALRKAVLSLLLPSPELLMTRLIEPGE